MTPVNDPLTGAARERDRVGRAGRNPVSSPPSQSIRDPVSDHLASARYPCPGNLLGPANEPGNVKTPAFLGQGRHHSSNGQGRWTKVSFVILHYLDPSNWPTLGSQHSSGLRDLALMTPSQPVRERRHSISRPTDGPSNDLSESAPQWSDLSALSTPDAFEGAEGEKRDSTE